MELFRISIKGIVNDFRIDFLKYIFLHESYEKRLALRYEKIIHVNQ